MKKDIRKEQLSLLRFEKQIAGLAVALAATTSAAKAADVKLAGTEAAQAYVEMQAAVMKLAEVTGAAHEALNAQALEAGMRVLQVSGGVPKKPPTEVVASILGLG